MMERTRFDSVAKHLHAVRSRRAGLRVLLAGLGAAVVGLVTHDETPAACRIKGAKCKKDSQCCSRRCSPRSNNRRGKACQCSQLQERCRGTRSCCGNLLEICARNNCGGGRVCCVPEGIPCEFNCDCCSNLVCGGFPRVCQPRLCSETREPCASSDDCCAEADICANVLGDCGATGTVCCAGEGATCSDDCDCCGALQCSGNTCILA